jgi:hypothetical protein
VRELLAEFDGLTGVQARVDVQAAAGLSRATLTDLVQGDRLDTAVISRLLRAMQERARPVKPEALGVLKQDYVTGMFTGKGMAADTVTYRCAKGVADGLPYILEMACGWGEDPEACRRLLYGYNHAPTLRTPFFRLPAWLQRADIEVADPVTVLVHLAYPRLEATDRGKTSVTLPWSLERVLEETFQKATQRWTKLKQHVRRAGRKQALQEARERRQQRPLSTKEAAWQVMEAAYLKASNGGRHPANARQIMYAARPDVIRLTGKVTPWKHSSYFTQRLLPDFVAEHPEVTAAWDVVFDARGHFREPHTGTVIGLGTLEVRDYMDSWRQTLTPCLDALQLPHTITTQGPYHRYRFALFVEKEGFDPLLRQAALESRYDVALMSSKGMTVTALRQLVDALSQAGVTILVVHDFDKSGLEILETFTSNSRRYQYTVPPTVIDLGLRLEEALQMGLDSEPVTYTSKVDPRTSLRRCGASEEECAFLVHGRDASRADREDTDAWDEDEDAWDEDEGTARRKPRWHGERIELNAMDSQQFLDWLEEKLESAGVEKVVPDPQTLAVVYQYFTQVAQLQQTLDAAMATPAPLAKMPAEVEARIREFLSDDTTLSWDEALWEIVCNRADEEDAVNA